MKVGRNCAPDRSNDLVSARAFLSPDRGRFISKRFAFSLKGFSTGKIAGNLSLAFSLLELLVVIAIMAILTTLYWNSTSGSRAKKNYAGCETNLQKLYIALEVYANEHGTKFPEKPGARVSGEVLDTLIPKYTSDNSFFICPASKDRPLTSGESLQKHTISYAYYMGRRAKEPTDALMTDRQVDTNSKVAGQAIFSATGDPPGNNHGKNGGNILFCDGHVQHAPPNTPFSLVLTQGLVLLNP